MDEVANDLIAATDPDRWAAAAAEGADAADDEAYEPNDQELRVARDTLLTRAVEPLMKAEARQPILSLREQAAQLIDMTTPDALVFAGWTDAGQARDAVSEFEGFVKEHHNEYLALQAYYQRPYRLRPDARDQ